ncbi:MAG: hypothetical protein ABIR38_06685 [Chthoniobacterales bacterium]
MKKSRNLVSVRAGHVEFLKLNAEKWEWRDAYQWMLALTWPQFALVVGSVYLTLNVLFGETTAFCTTPSRPEAEMVASAVSAKKSFDRPAVSPYPLHQSDVFSLA